MLFQIVSKNIIKYVHYKEVINFIFNVLQIEIGAVITDNIHSL